MRATVLALVLMAGPAAMAAAQPVTRLVDVALKVDARDQVAVVDGSGITVWGRLTRVTPEQLVIEEPSGQARTFAAADVRRIERRGDTLRNGLLIGATVGGALGGALGWFSGEFRAADFLQGIAWFGGVGLGIGLGVDALHVGNTTIFTAPAASGRSSRHAGDRITLTATRRW